MFLLCVVMLVLFDLSFLLQTMLGFLLLFLLTFIFFTCVTHMFLLSVVCLIFFIRFQLTIVLGVAESVDLPLGYNQNNLLASDLSYSGAWDLIRSVNCHINKGYKVHIYTLTSLSSEVKCNYM